MAKTLAGKITHYYDLISVAVVDVKKPLSVGDSVKIVGHGKEFIQTINSMQIEHEQIQKAKKGIIIGLQVDQPVKEGDQIFLVETQKK